MSIKKIVYTGYEPTKWVDGVTPINAENLNHIEQGIYDCSAQTIHNAVDINHLTEAVFEVDNTCPEGVHKTVSKVDKLVTLTNELKTTVEEHETSLEELQSKTRSNELAITNISNLVLGGDVTRGEHNILVAEVDRQGKILATHENRLNEKADKVEVSQAEARINESLVNYATRTFVESEVRSFVETSCANESGAIKREIMAEDVKAIDAAKRYTDEKLIALNIGQYKKAEEVDKQDASLKSDLNALNYVVTQLEAAVSRKADKGASYTKSEADDRHNAINTQVRTVQDAVNSLLSRMVILETRVQWLYDNLENIDEPVVDYAPPKDGINLVINDAVVTGPYQLVENEQITKVTCQFEAGTNPCTIKVKFAGNVYDVTHETVLNDYNEATYEFVPPVLPKEDTTLVVEITDNVGATITGSIIVKAYIVPQEPEEVTPLYPTVVTYKDIKTELTPETIATRSDFKYEIKDDEGNVLESGYFSNTDDVAVVGKPYEIYIPQNEVIARVDKFDALLQEWYTLSDIEREEELTFVRDEVYNSVYYRVYKPSQAGTQLRLIIGE